MNQIYLKWHRWPETICKKVWIEWPISKTFRNFQNILKSFGEKSPSWKRLLLFPCRDASHDSKQQYRCHYHCFIPSQDMACALFGFSWTECYASMLCCSLRGNPGVIFAASHLKRCFGVTLLCFTAVSLHTSAGNVWAMPTELRCLDCLFI